ncbi:MAG: hypothetical protein U0174_22840 [Polyangiaceae bacterium]
MRLRYRGAWVIPLATAVIAVSCLAPTQARLILTTQAACEAALAGSPKEGVFLTDAVIYVGTSLDDLALNEGATTSAAQIRCEDITNKQRQNSLVLLRGTTDSAFVRVVVGTKVVAGSGVTRTPAGSCKANGEDTCIRATRVFRYRSNETVEVHVNISSACAGVRCGTGETCVDGGCRNAQCSDNGGRCDDSSLGKRDGGTTTDAATDAATDASLTRADGGSDPVGPVLFTCEGGLAKIPASPCFIGEWCYAEPEAKLKCEAPQCEAPNFAPCCKTQSDGSCCLSKGTLHPIDVSGVKADNRILHCDPRRTCFEAKDCEAGQTCVMDKRGGGWGMCTP